MTLSIGTRLGPYEIQAPLGAGGMGEVYRARDTQLNRDVAIKILPEAFSADADRVARFQREAQVLASLNHPNIAQIYGLEHGPAEAGHHRSTALVLELVEGSTLADRIAHGPIPLDEALPIAKQIAEGLEAAHEQAIIHRDLKPANIKLTSDGKVKVLDFGLAKAMDAGSTKQDPAYVLSQSPTITSPALMTGGGVILGTAAYMSPEQARGKIVDKRSDIWAFGCVLYEMIAGKPPFSGDEVADVLASIITREPDWQRLSDTPEPLRRLLRRCLEKSRRQRLADIADAVLEIDEALTLHAMAPSANRQRWSQIWPLGLGVFVAALAGTAVVWTIVHPAVVARPVMSLQLALPSFALDPTDVDIALSPDGMRVVYTSGTRRLGQELSVRSLDGTEPIRLEGTQNARTPFFSPDGEWVGFEQIQNLKKVSVHGGSPVIICEKCAGGIRGATWGPNDVIIFSANGGRSGLLEVSATGGVPAAVTTVDNTRGEQAHIWPEFLPGGDSVVFGILATGRVGQSRIAARNLKTGTQRILINGATYGRYVSPGFLVYGAGQSLQASRFDPNHLAIAGDPSPVKQRVLMKGSGAAEFIVSRNGSLLYVPGDVHTAERSLVWVGRDGREETIAAPPRPYLSARISPDGQSAVLDVRDQENDIWIWRFAAKTLTRFTFDPGPDESPTWTPDGRRIAYGSIRGGKFDLYWKAADGSGAPERISKTPESGNPYCFTPDGQWLISRQADAKSGSDFVMVSMKDDREVKPLLRTDFKEMNATISPDGRWIAYDSDESSQVQVYVRPFPQVDTGRWQISNDGGNQPLWSPTGKELFYVDPAGRIMAVPMSTISSFSIGTPAIAVERPYALASESLFRSYDVTHDGKRFLMIKDDVSQTNSLQPGMVLNWTEELKLLLSAKH